MAKMFNRARMTVTSTGTGALSLGVAVAGYQTFSSAGAQNNDVVSYAVEDGLKWEIGTGTYNSVAGTLSRTVTQSFDGTTYGTSAISVTTSAQVFISPLAADLQYGTSAGNLVQLDGSARLPAVDGSLVTALNASNISSGTLGVARGGTGLTSLTAGRIPFGAGVSGTDPFGNSANLTYSGVQLTLGGADANVYLSNYGSYRLNGGNSTGFIYGSFGAFGDGIHLGYNYYANAAGTGVITNTGGGTTRLSLGYNYITFNISASANTAPVEAMRIASDGSVGIGYQTTSGIGANGLAVLGNVGIGTASPTTNLTLVNTSQSYSNNPGNAALKIYATATNAASPLFLNLGYDASADVGYIQPVHSGAGGTFTNLLVCPNGGNLGLGVTPSAWAGFINFQVSRAALSADTGSVFLSYNTYYNGNWKYIAASQPASQYQQYNGAHLWFTTGSTTGSAGGAVNGTGSFTQAMTLTSGGNLGIGDTAPNSKLVVRAGTDQNLAVNPGYLVSTAVLLQSQNNTGGSLIPLEFRSSQISFDIGSSEAARIDASGNLLVGTQSQFNSCKVGIEASAATFNIFCIQNTNTGNAGNLVVFTNSAGAACGSINQTGATTISYNNSSDYRLKKNIAPINNALDRVLNLKPSKFQWVADNLDSEGFIAHELQAYLPYAVTGEKDGEQMQGVDYSKLTPILTAAIQELAAKVQALEAKVA